MYSNKPEHPVQSIQLPKELSRFDRIWIIVHRDERYSEEASERCEYLYYVVFLLVFDKIKKSNAGQVCSSLHPTEEYDFIV